ncbi:MAG: cupredoxin domain-containing protein [Ardenticatenaceae bacterium]|nr:cupredoxin domain-containing protein [Ardenticatenaceae bacterium]HBY99650.1 hypothetical protein [Chloroflexota bacterium]
MRIHWFPRITAVIALTLLAGWLQFGQAAAQGTTEVQISETEFSLNPAKVTVPMGQPIRFTVTNAGTVEHNLNVELPSKSIEKTLFDTNLKPGETKTAEFTFTTAGSWEMYCPVDAHEDKGMKGEIEVVATAGAPAQLPQTGGAASENSALWLVIATAAVLVLALGVWFRRRGSSMH